MSAPAITLHLLAAIIWVGGMFFAYLAARPVLAELDTQLRARPPVRIRPLTNRHSLGCLIPGCFHGSSGKCRRDRGLLRLRMRR